MKVLLFTQLGWFVEHDLFPPHTHTHFLSRCTLPLFRFINQLGVIHIERGSALFLWPFRLTTFPTFPLAFPLGSLTREVEQWLLTPRT